MAAPFDSLLLGAEIVNQVGRFAADIGIRGGRIAEIGALASRKSRETVDCRGLTILPGVIDTQVHFREPGLTHKEDLESGSRGAVLGGVTAVFEMPNTNPNTTTEETLAAKVAAAHHRMHCDFAFFVGGTAENIEEVPRLEKLPGAAGIKVFIGSSTGNLLVEDDENLCRILKKITRRASFHCEDEPRLRARMDLRVPGDPSSHPVWRDEEAALLATRRLVTLARRLGKRVHVLHLSTGEEMEWLADHKDVASVEVTPHHLTLAAPECYARLGTYAQMNPPVRDAAHREKLWWGVNQGIADILGSDHAPHTHEEKRHAYPASHSGMTGVQTLVPVMLDHVNAGRLTLERFVDMTSHGPARLFNIAAKGRIAVGYDADLTLVDMKRRETITDAWIASKCGWTPYDGVSVTGWPVGTFVRGTRVMWQGGSAGRGTRRNRYVANGVRAPMTMTSPTGNPPAVTFTLGGVWRGIKRQQPFTPGILAYALAFGLVAAQAKLSMMQATAMSVLVFSGSAQVAAIGILSAGAASLAAILWAVLGTVLVMNARYILYSAALRPWLGQVSPLKAYSSLFFLGDGGWLLAMRAYEEGERDAGYVMGTSAGAFLAWTGGTMVGAFAVGFAPDPHKLGFDFLLVAFSAAMMAGMFRGRGDLPVMAVSALVALAVAPIAGFGGAVVAAGIAGGAVAWLRARDDRGSDGQDRSATDAVG
jgi:dihydroorotase